MDAWSPLHLDSSTAVPGDPLEDQMRELLEALQPFSGACLVASIDCNGVPQFQPGLLEALARTHIGARVFNGGPVGFLAHLATVLNGLAQNRHKVFLQTTDAYRSIAGAPPEPPSGRPVAH